MYVVINTETGILEVKQGTPTLAQQQEVVGGYIETLFTIDSPTGVKDRMLTGYVNEEGLLIGLPLFRYLDSNYMERPEPRAGNLVISALDYSDGETVAMVQKEVDYVKDHWFPFLNLYKVDK